MAALMIINFDLTDAELMAKYREGAIPLWIKSGVAKVVAASDATVDLAEGNSAGRETVVLEFESVEAAETAYNSAEYQAILPSRLNATSPKIAMIVKTVG